MSLKTYNKSHIAYTDTQTLRFTHIYNVKNERLTVSELCGILPHYSSGD